MADSVAEKIQGAEEKYEDKITHFSNPGIRPGRDAGRDPGPGPATTKPKGVPQSDGRASASGQQAEGMVSTAGGGAKNRGNSLLCPSEGK